MLFRIFIFILTNLSVLVLSGIIMSLLGINMHDNLGLFIWAGCFGFGGAFISLILSKKIAKIVTKAVVIKTPNNQKEQWLFSIVKRQSEQAGINMPEIAIFPAKEANAFATGMSRNKSLVAISSGLWSDFTNDQIEAVIGHEIGHIANGDMVTLTLIQGVLNTFIIAGARIVGNIINGYFSDDEDSHYGFGYFITVILLEILFGIFASIIVLWFSRKREYRADIAGAQYSSRAKMISALEQLKQNHDVQLPKSLKAFGISSKKQNMISKIFSSHPTIESRINHLQNADI